VRQEQSQSVISELKTCAKSVKSPNSSSSLAAGSATIGFPDGSVGVAAVEVAAAVVATASGKGVEVVGLVFAPWKSVKSAKSSSLSAVGASGVESTLTARLSGGVEAGDVVGTGAFAGGSALMEGVGVVVEGAAGVSSGGEEAVGGAVTKSLKSSSSAADGRAVVCVTGDSVAEEAAAVDSVDGSIVAGDVVAVEEVAVKSAGDGDTEVGVGRTAPEDDDVEPDVVLVEAAGAGATKSSKSSPAAADDCC
jgi:hypothetical protein